MRIGIDVQSTLGDAAGIGRYAAQLLAALRQVGGGHAYHELSMGRAVVMRTDRRLRWQQWTLPRQARKTGCDLLHVTGFDAPVRKTCPTVLTAHDLIGMLFPRNLPLVARFYWSRWLPHTVRKADHVIADSRHTKRDLVRVLSVPEERITVVHLGVDEAFRPISDRDRLESVRQRYGLPLPFILYVGTIEPRKGLDVLVSSYHRLAADIPHDLVIAGKRGWYVEPLIHQVERLGLTERVHFAGYVADDDLPMLYNLADLFVFPSRYEGFGLPPLEALACGVPVICTDAASLPEVVGDAGLLVPVDDVPALAAAMGEALYDEARRAWWREKGLARAASFTWEAAARKTIQVYERVV